MALNELVLRFRPTGGFDSPAAAAAAGGGDDGDDSEEGQSSAPAVEGDVVEGLGGACSGAQAGMIIGRAMREAFLATEALRPPRGGLVVSPDEGGVTPSFGVVRVRAVRIFGCGVAGSCALPLVLRLASRSAAWYFCMVPAAASWSTPSLSLSLRGEES